MPNILWDKDKIAGFVDLDGAGVADRYVDIAIFFRSFRRNSRNKVDIEDPFCQAYGLESICPKKLAFYTQIDDLF